MSVAFLDVDYRDTFARAACVVAESWGAASPSAQYTVDVSPVQAYEPGRFYRRELPCLLEVLDALPHRPAAVVVDGYVWLADASRAGLGAHLFAALGSKTPVIGIAKTPFHGAGSSAAVVKVLRGASVKPLYVTAAGEDVANAAAWVAGMAGPYRVPTLLTAVDRLARSPGCLPQRPGADGGPR